MAHSQLVKSAGLVLAAISLMSAAYAADQNASAPATDAAVQVAPVQTEAPKWIALPVADVSFYKNNFLNTLETIFQKVGAPAVPNMITVPIQHISRVSEAKVGSKAYTKELEEFTKYILRAIVNGDESSQPTLKLTTNSGGERLEYTIQDKKMTGLYFAYSHEELGIGKITCIGFVTGNGRTHALFAQSSATKFPNCKAEILDLLMTIPIVKAEQKISSAKDVKVKKVTKSIKTATITE